MTRSDTPERGRSARLCRTEVNQAQRSVSAGDLENALFLNKPADSAQQTAPCIWIPSLFVPAVIQAPLLGAQTNSCWVAGLRPAVLQLWSAGDHTDRVPTRVSYQPDRPELVTATEHKDKLCSPTGRPTPRGRLQHHVTGRPDPQTQQPSTSPDFYSFGVLPTSRQ